MAFAQPDDDWSSPIQTWSDPIAILQRYAGIQNGVYRRILIEVFRNAIDNGVEINVAEVMECVHKLLNDQDENVRHEIIEQLPQVVSICQEAPERFGDVLSNHLIHHICGCLVDDDQQVRQTTFTVLMTFVQRGMLDKGSIEFPVAPTLLMMSEQPGKLDFVTLAIDVMSKVASILEPATAEKLFLRRYLSLCRDGNFFIRKLCALRFGEFSAALPKDTVHNKLLPMYVTLCKDAFWIVRKSCAEVIVSVACTVSLEHRRTILSKILANFLSEESKWVRLSAYQILGPFISTFAKQYSHFSYNQYGEFVMTDHHGAELRYNIGSFNSSFSGSPDNSMAASKVTTDENYDNMSNNNNTNNNSSNNSNIGNNNFQQNNEISPLNNFSKVQWCSVSSLESSNCYDNARSSTPINNDNNNNSNDDNSLTEEHNLFNPFLYYYIPPELKLDDELVRAATATTTSSSSSSSSVLPTNNNNNEKNQEKPTIIINDQNHEIIDNYYNETSNNNDDNNKTSTIIKTNDHDNDEKKAKQNKSNNKTSISEKRKKRLLER